MICIQVRSGGFNGQSATLRHCVTSIDDKINDDLLNLSRIGLHASHRRIQDYGQFDVLPNERAEHLRSFYDYCIKVENDRLKHLLAAECQKLLSQGSSSVCGFLNRLHSSVQYFVAFDGLGQHQIRMTYNRRQNVVEVMGHSPCQYADSLHRCEISSQIVRVNDVVGILIQLAVLFLTVPQRLFRSLARLISRMLH